MVQLNRELNQEWIFRISFQKYSWRISLSLQLPLESSKHLWAQRKFLVGKF